MLVSIILFFPQNINIVKIVKFQEIARLKREKQNKQVNSFECEQIIEKQQKTKKNIHTLTQ